MSEKKCLNPAEWDKPVTRENYWQWREYMKASLLYKRHYRSDLSGLPLNLSTGCHVHEAILSRANVPKSVDWFWRIFDERNCLLLLPSEHIPTPPSRKWAIEYLYGLYGREVIHEWYYDLPFKSFPFQLP